MKRSSIIFVLALSLLTANFCLTDIEVSERHPSDLPSLVYRSGWALLIGINDYPNLPAQFQLNYAAADATELAELLQEMYGFLEEHVTVLTNEEATKQGITDALASLADSNRVNTDDCVLVFFSGHGQTVPLTHGGEMGFLIPHDAELDLSSDPNYGQYYRDCIGMDELQKLAKGIPARHVLFLVDSCYSGLAVRSLKGLSPETMGYLKKVAKVPVREIITAGRRGEESIESADWGHGAFTHKLLEGLRTEAADYNDDGVITAFELGTYIKLVVPRLVDQTPLFGYLDGEGEFIFLPQGPETATLVVEVSPTGYVSLNGGTESQAPLSVSEIEAGDHTITVSAPDFQTKTMTVALSPGDEKRLSVDLDRARVELRVNSIPDGAEVTLDGEPRGRTPLLLNGVPTGEHTLRMSLENHVSIERPITVHAPPQPVTVSMEPVPATVEISSTPADASIYLNGGLLEERTPATLKLSAGEYALELHKPLHRSVSRTIRLENGLNPSISLSMEAQVATLSISSTPEGAAIRVNGILRSEITPAKVTLPPGKHRIIVEHGDYAPYENEVTLADGQEMRLEASLSAQTQLYITADPPGARINLGKLGIHKAPALVQNIAPGNYEARAGMKGYRSEAQTFSVSPYIRNTLNIRLLPKSRTRMVLYSLVIPGSGQYYGGSYGSGTIFLLAGAMAATGSVMSWLQYGQSVDDYENSVDRYNEALSQKEIDLTKGAMLDAHDNADKKFLLKQFMFAAMGTVWAGSAVHAYMTGPAIVDQPSQAMTDPPGWSVVPRIMPHLAGINILRRF